MCTPLSYTWSVLPALQQPQAGQWWQQGVGIASQAFVLSTFCLQYFYLTWNFQCPSWNIPSIKEKKDKRNLNQCSLYFHCCMIFVFVCSTLEWLWWFICSIVLAGTWDFCSICCLTRMACTSSNQFYSQLRQLMAVTADTDDSWWPVWTDIAVSFKGRERESLDCVAADMSCSWCSTNPRFCLALLPLISRVVLHFPSCWIRTWDLGQYYWD